MGGVTGSGGDPQPSLDRTLRLEISPSRHLITVGILAVLAFLLGSLAFEIVGSRFLSGLFLAAMAGLGAFAAYRVWMARHTYIEFTGDAVRTSTGRVLCNIEDVTTVQRGMLAFKPSGGFVLRTKTRQTKGWLPGVWWVLGRSVGVGGVTTPGQAKAMADVIAIEIARRT